MHSVWKSRRSLDFLSDDLMGIFSTLKSREFCTHCELVTQSTYFVQTANFIFLEDLGVNLLFSSVIYHAGSPKNVRVFCVLSPSFSARMTVGRV